METGIGEEGVDVGPEGAEDGWGYGTGAEGELGTGTGVVAEPARPPEEEPAGGVIGGGGAGLPGVLPVVDFECGEELSDSPQNEQFGPTTTFILLQCWQRVGAIASPHQLVPRE